MSEMQLTLSERQCEILERLLTHVVKQKQIEAHRTEFSREFRREVEDEEAQLRAVLDMLSSKPA